MKLLLKIARKSASYWILVSCFIYPCLVRAAENIILVANLPQGEPFVFGNRYFTLTAKTKADHDGCWPAILSPSYCMGLALRREEKILRQKLTKLGKKSLGMKWQVADANAETIKDHLVNPNVQNIVLVMHGNTDGLFDSGGNLIPSDTFKNISSSIRSISIFSCFHVEIVKIYEIFKNWDSISDTTQRVLVTPNGSNLGITLDLPEFMKELDGYLDRTPPARDTSNVQRLRF